MEEDKISKWDSLIESPSAQETKVIPTDQQTETLDKEPVTSKWDNLSEEGESKAENITYDKRYDINVNDYRDELGSDIFMPEGDNGVDILNHNRAKNQALYDQVGNFLGQAVVGEIIGGTIEGLGYLLDIGSIVDVMQGDEADWGNFMTDFGQSIREGTEEALQIHTDPFAEGWGKMADSGWWFSNAVSVASTLSMLIPTTGAMKALSFLGKGIGASRGMQAVRRAVGMAEEMGTKSRWMTNGISQAVLSRNIENWMEAHGTFEDEKQHLLNSINPETGKAFTEEEATQGASEAAANNWKNGWAMLLQDIPQYMAIGKVFNPVTGKMMNAQSAAAQKGIKAGLKPWQQKGLDIGKTFFGEAGEEAYQFYISERAKLQTDLKLGLIDQKEYDRKMSDALGSEEMLTSAFFGGLGGNVFQMAGPALNRALKSKDRKQYEEQLEKYYGEMVNNNAKQVSLLYHHLNESDQQTSPIQREAVINEMMLNMTAEALEADKFELFLESMDQISGMSEEAVQQYNEQTGSEFNRELAASYAPRIKQKALEMRDRYLKHRNHYNKRTSSALARLELENAQYNEFINKKQKDVNSIRNDINASWENLASKSLKDKLAINEEYAVLTRRKKALAAQLKAETSSVKKSWIEKAINSNESNIKFNRKKRREYDKAKKNLDSVMKELEENKASDNVQAESAYQAHKRQLYDALELEAVAKERILINNEEMNHIKTDEGQKMVKSRILSEKLEEYETIDSLENLKEEVNNSEIAKEDSEELLNKIGEKIAVLKVEEDAAKAKAAKAQSEENARRKNSERNNNPAVVSNQNKTTIIDVVEDEDSEEMPTFDKDQLDESDRAINSKIGSGRLMAVLDKVDGTEAFQDWMEIPVSKVGEVFNYTVSDRSQKLSKAQNDAIQSFENGNITQEVYDNLPIKLTLDGQPKIFSFIPTKPTASDSQEKKNNYKRGYNSQRKIIIDKLAKKEKVFSKVAKNSGGDLVKDFDAETNTDPNNSILDILQIGNNMDNIELRVTDDKGFLMDTNKDYDTRFGKPMMIDEDSNGNKKPYKGGVFLILKKANGEPFALRLNLAKNTDAQSELLADLLIKIAVPDPVLNDDGTFAKQKNKDDKETIMVSPKELKLTSPISELDQETLSLVKDLMGPEIDMLDKEYKDPTIMSLINSFVYTNDNTEGKTTELFIRGNDLFFGGNRMSPGFKNNSKMRNQLIEFLKNTKKRQFNIKNWSENKAYRKYVIDNQIISTNAATGVNSFINTRKYDKTSGKMTGRRIQIFMEPIGTPKSSPIVVDDSEITISNDYIDEDGVATAITIDENGNLVMANKPFQNEPTQQSSDTQVRKEKEDVVSSKPNVTLINDSQITFESQIEEDTDEDWDDIDMSSTDDLDGMDSGEMTEKCN